MDQSPNLKKYLVCISSTQSHEGALVFVCENLKHRRDVQIELFSVIKKDEEELGFFKNASNNAQDDFMSTDEKKIEKILIDAKDFIHSRISNQVEIKIEFGKTAEVLKTKILEDKSIIAMVLGVSSESFTKNNNLSSILEKVSSVTTTPLILVPRFTTSEQITKIIDKNL
jgi:hypothetical protein